MLGWAFLYAFITSIAFITTLIGVGSLVMGSIYRDRSLIFFGLKALLIAILAFIVICIFLWQQLNALGEGIANFLKFFLK